MKICISAGHNVVNNGTFDPGAVGNGLREADISKAAAKELIKLLKQQGHEAFDVTPYDRRFRNKKAAHQERANRVNAIRPDLYLDLHLNSGGGTGPECWVYKNTGAAANYADKISKSLAKDTGLRNRGVKVNPSFWSLNMTKAPAIIIEGAFIDSKKDMDKLSPSLYAKSVAKVFGAVKEDKPVKKPNKHWGEKHYESLKKKGITIHDKRFDDKITRAEVFALLDRIVK